MRVWLVFIAVIAALGAWLWLRGSPNATEFAREPFAAPAEPAQTPVAPAKLDVPIATAENERSEATPSPALATPAPAKATAPARNATLVGRMVDALGVPIADAELWLRGGTALSVKTPADGRFLLSVNARDRSEPWSVDVDAYAPRYVTGHRDVVLREGEETNIGDWKLELGASLFGRVVDERGRSVEGARVLVRRASNLERDWARRQDPGKAEVDTLSDARGEFRLDGVASGRVRPWATKARYLNGVGEAVEIAAGQEVRDLVLVLDPEAEDDAFDITVLNPDGTPSPRAIVAYEYETQVRSGSGSQMCDEAGRLHFVVQAKGLHDFRARDAKGEFGFAVATRRMPGDAAFVMQLEEKREFVLEVVDVHGEPVRGFRAEFTDADGDSHSQLDSIAPSAESPPGRATLPVPPVAFLIHVRAAGYRDADVGPFEPSTLPPLVRATLHGVAGIAGRVLADGKPLANAEVRAGRPVDAKLARIVNGFPANKTFEGSVEARSGADGTFIVFPENAGEVWLRVEHAGRAAALVGPLHFDPDVGLAGVEIELGRGGAIEGRVLLPAGENVHGAIVGASCGDGHGRTTRADADGRYRFDELTPGAWLVKRCDEEIVPYSTTTSTSSVDSAVELPTSCIVREGEVTHFDLDLRVDARPRARGRLLLGGGPAVGWAVDAETLGAHFDPPGHAETDAEGRFDVRAPSAGAGTLRLRSNGPGDGWRAFGASVAWRLGETTWERDLPVGKLEFGPALDGAAQESYRASWRAEGGLLWCDVSVALARDGSRVLDALPAGTWKIKSWRDGSMKELGSVEVTSGGLARFDPR
ncbi:MAG: carboxypeptidase regulatory-like domain-containing protein [Planctomycetes bacterium]|nr:carboxypeptidase regulatory-like domain-containing protein [Planctomycetota bacterium]